MQDHDFGELPPLQALVSLRGRRAVVTGGGRGIGRAIAFRLAEAGAAVTIGDVDAERAAATAAAIARATGSQVAGTDMDVTDAASVAATAAGAVARFGGLDTWINNAGVLHSTGPLEDADEELWDEVVRVNLRGAFLGCREAARRFAGPGVIVNVSSITSLRATPASSAYVSTKSAIVGLTRAAAKDLGPRGIRVVAVAPGFVETPGTREVSATFGERGLDFDAMASANPLGRLAVPDDIGRAVLFCASDLATHVSGSLVVVDGGSTS